MKTQILKVVTEAKRKGYLSESEFKLTVNYKIHLGSTYQKTVLLKDVDLYELNISLMDIKKIDGYNLTLKIERGTRNVNNGDYAPNWKSIEYVFWTGYESDEKSTHDKNKVGAFEFMTYGERESFSGNGIREKLWRFKHVGEDEDDDDYERIDGNYFLYENVGNVIDYLHEFDILLDKQHDEKLEIYNKLRLELPIQ